MARKPKAAVNSEVEAFRPYLEGVAKKIAHDLFGPQGPPWGTTLTQLEKIALQTRAMLTEKFLEHSLEQQAATAVEERPAALQVCPGCQKPWGEPKEREPRNITTRAGEATWSEPKEYCTRCRRAFFPSEQKSRH